MNDHRRSPEIPSLLARVERVRPIAEAHALASERGRTLAPAVVEALRESGLFAVATPRALGGLECDPLGQIEIFAAMAHADGSAGWSLMIAAMVNALAGAYLPDAGVARVFGGRPPICAGLLQPMGVARRAPGGYRVSGRWAFGSGVRHADWIFTGAAVDPAPEGPPSFMSVAVPAAAVQIEDTWDAAGLRGSGSDHYRLEDVFVPEELTCPFPAPPRLRGGPLYTLPLMPLLAPAHIGVALGLGRRALDEIVAAAPAKLRTWTRSPLRDAAAFQHELGRAEASLGSARAYAFEVMGRLWDRALAGEAFSPADSNTARLAIAHATDTAIEVATFAFRAGGASALYSASPIQRCLRDLLAAGQHVAAAGDAYEASGQALLGFEELHPLLAPRPDQDGAGARR